MNNRAENPQNLTEQLTVAWTKAQPMVTAYIASTIHKPDDVEDVLQEVAVAVARGYESSDRSLPFGPWAMGIARHKVFDYHRRNARDKHLFDDELLHAVEQGYAAIAPESSQRAEALKRCMKILKQRAVKLLNLRYNRDLKPAQIAEMTGMTANAVTVTLHRARTALRDCIERRLTAQSEHAGGES